MNIQELPTGFLFSDTYSKGELETLSIADYGKHHNVKADFLGYTDVIQGVPNVPCMPLQEKWVVTLSTQYGCFMDCTFCDVPKIAFKGNATFKDLQDQLVAALGLFPEIKYTERLNIHFARMGEPILNDEVFKFATWLTYNKSEFQEMTGVHVETIHPVLTTSLPRKFKGLESSLLRWCEIKNLDYNGQAGLQLSINSTDDAQRDEMFREKSLSLEEISKICAKFPNPISRKYCLNIAYSTDFEVDAEKIDRLFDREKFMVKITPIHNNNACRENAIETVGGYTEWKPYQKPEEDLKALGWDVLVFVPSLDEEDGLVTCGNLLLGGSEGTFGKPLNIKGLQR